MSNKSSAVANFIWKFLERCTAEIITLVVTIILARLLVPEDYAVIAIVNIFITIANSFVTGGLGTALIQKKDADSIDFSSMFYFSIFMGAILYAILFVSAPFVADYYDNALLCPVLRVISLRLPLSTINSVQHAYVSRTMQFRKFFWSTLFGTIVSAFVGIYLAYSGFGAWALVAQYLTNSTIDTIVLFIIMPWRPTLEFSFKRLKVLLSFSWKLALSGLINSVYNELRSFVVAKEYTKNELSYYTQGRKYPSFCINLIDSSVKAVLLPVMAKKQDDINNVKNTVRLSISISLFLLCPIMFGMAATAESFIGLLLTDKWLPCVPFFQIACFTNVLFPVQTNNLQAVDAIGRSDYHLKMEILKKGFGILTIIIFVKYGLMALALSEILVLFVTTIINTAPNTKLLKYSYKEQFADVTPVLFAGAVMLAVICPINLMQISRLVKLLIQIPLGAFVYLTMSKVLKLKGMSYFFTYVRKLIKR